MKEMRDVGLPKETLAQINEIKEARRNYEKECARLYNQLTEANALLDGKVGTPVRFSINGESIDGFLLSGTPVENPSHLGLLNEKRATNAGYIVTRTNIFRSGDFDRGDYNSVALDLESQKKFSLHKYRGTFMVFEGDAAQLQKAIDISLALAMPKHPEVKGLERVEIKLKEGKK